MNNIHMKYVKPLLLVAVLFIVSPLYSAGIGIYSSGNFNYYKFDNIIYPITNPDLNKIEHTPAFSPGLGIVIDSNLAKNKLFNYRFNLGFEQIFIFFKDDSKLYRFNLINVFGFNLYSNDFLRLYMGPILGLHYLFGKRVIEHFGWVAGFIFPVTYIGPFKQNVNYGSLNMDTGLDIGINLNFKNNFSFSIEVGLSFSYAAGDIDRKIIPNFVLFHSNEDFRFIGFESRLTLSALYRINDNYSL